MSRQYMDFVDALYPYDELVDSYVDNFETVVIDDDFISRLSVWVNDLVRAKSGERHHQIDGNHESKRWTTGYLGEYAVEQYIGKRFVDWSIGKSGNYRAPDLTSIGIDCGIKTVEYGKFPLVFKNSHSPEFIVIRKDHNTFWMCGYANTDVLNSYQADELVLSKALRERGTKAGFYGFDKLTSPVFLKMIVTFDLEEIKDG